VAFELELIKILQSIRSDFFDALFQFFTMFGEELVIIGILGFFYWIYNKKIGESMGISVFISLVLNSTMKTLFQRLRPFQVDSAIENVRPQTSGGYSFPSGHTQGAATVFSSVALFIKKKWMTITSGTIIFLVALSRMYIGVHYLSDVLVGAILGILISTLVFRYLHKNEDNSKIYRFIFLVSAMVLTAITIWHRVLLSNEIMVVGHSDATSLFERLEDGYKMVGAMLGFLLGVTYEKKRVNFTHHRNIFKNIVRFGLGVLIVMAIRLGLSAFFDILVHPEELQMGQFFLAFIALVLDFIRYGVMVFIAIGVYPILFKKWNI